MSKFILTGVEVKEVKGLMSDLDRLSAVEERIREATEEVFKELDRSRREAWVKSSAIWLD